MAKDAPKARVSKKWKAYAANNQGLVRKSRFCPKCGAGVFLAAHKDRTYCGTCHYTEFTKK